MLEQRMDVDGRPLISFDGRRAAEDAALRQKSATIQADGDRSYYGSHL